MLTHWFHLTQCVRSRGANQIVPLADGEWAGFKKAVKRLPQTSSLYSGEWRRTEGRRGFSENATQHGWKEGRYGGRLLLAILSSDSSLVLLVFLMFARNNTAIFISDVVSEQWGRTTNTTTTNEKNCPLSLQNSSLLCMNLCMLESQHSTLLTWNYFRTT